MMMNEKSDYSKSDYKVAGEKLYHALHLSTYPVAIKYIKSEEEIPRRAIRPSTMGRKPRKLSICQAFTIARRMGVTVALTADENFCVPSSAMHGWIKVSLEDIIESQIKQGWHKDAESEKRRTRMMNDLLPEGLEGLQKKGYIGVIASPLPMSLIIPDSILIYGSGAQITHVIQALNYECLPEYVPSSTFEGFGESCGKGGLFPFLMQKPQIVIPGMGDRSFAGIQEHEIGVGMPGFLLFYVIENLFKTGGMMNIGWPLKNLIPIHLTENITPGFKYLREKVDKG